MGDRPVKNDRDEILNLNKLDKKKSASSKDNDKVCLKQLMAALEIVAVLNEAITIKPGHDSALTVFDHMNLYAKLLDKTLSVVKQISGDDYSKLSSKELKRYTNIIVKFIATEQTSGKDIDIVAIKDSVVDFVKKNPDASFMFEESENKKKNKEIQVVMMMALSKFAHLGKERFDNYVLEIDRSISICLGAYKKQNTGSDETSKDVKIEFMEAMITSLSEIYHGALKKYEKIYEDDSISSEKNELIISDLIEECNDICSGNATSPEKFKLIKDYLENKYDSVGNESPYSKKTKSIVKELVDRCKEIHNEDIQPSKKVELIVNELNAKLSDNRIVSRDILEDIDRHAKGEFRGAFTLWASVTIAFNNGDILKIDGDENGLDYIGR